MRTIILSKGIPRQISEFKDPILRNQLKLAKARYYTERQDYNYVVNMGQILTTRQHPAYLIWKAKVLKRDNYKCAKCRGSDFLQVHHIKAWSKTKKLRLAIKNGITLCYQCHKRIHPWLKMDTRYGISHPIKALSEAVI